MVTKSNHKVQLVCQYIYEHLNDELTLDKLSQVANLSRFHFHRLFAIYTGITLNQFIQLVRLKYASYQLVFHPEYKIIDIALDANFESPESFSRAFKHVFGQTPSQFRKQPDWEIWHEKYQFPQQTRRQEMKVKIVNFKETKIAVLEHQGSPALVNNSALKFIEWRKSSQLSPIQSSQTYGIAYDDPENVAPETFRFDICGSVLQEIPEDNPQGVINKVIPAGRCAVVRHIGSHDNLEESVYYLYEKWLPESGEELRDYPCFFQYMNLFPEVDEHQLITDIHLPIK